MIHVQVRPDEISDEWLKKADALTELLRKAQDDEEGTAEEKRRKIIQNNQDVWRALKRVLSRWSHDKCWYSELRESGSDYHVDHFRPKGRVRNEGEKEREGYWWLAFEWTNYRIAVSWVNSPHRDLGRASQGKVDQFPLKPGSMPVEPNGDIAKEFPLLLDPTDEDDVLLVDYDESGLPVPTTSGWGEERVIGTRRLLHLDSQRMIDARRQVWRDCERRLQRAHESLSVAVDEHTRHHDQTGHNWILEICEMLRPDHELSSVALACVLKCEYVWAKRLPSHPLARLPEPYEEG